MCESDLERGAHCDCVCASEYSGSLRYSALLPHHSGIPVWSRAVCEQQERESHSEGIHILLALTKEREGGGNESEKEARVVKLRF